jgi:hypothetical protein
LLILGLLHRNLVLLNAILSASSSIPLAVWINLLTSNDRPKWLWVDASLDYVFPIATIVLLLVQYYVVRKLGGVARETAEGIGCILKFGVEILAARSGIEDTCVRGHCYRFENGKLMPIAYFTRGFQEDSDMEIPTSDGWFIISQSFTNNRVCCNSPDWREDRVSLLSRDIWREIRCVIACPIKPLPDPTNPSASKIAPIGIISFDASRTYEQMKWAKRKGGRIYVNPEIHEAMTALAAAAYVFIVRDLGNE